MCRCGLRLSLFYHSVRRDHATTKIQQLDLTLFGPAEEFLWLAFFRRRVVCGTIGIRGRQYLLSR
jgi:hypothetical protein